MIIVGLLGFMFCTAFGLAVLAGLAAWMFIRGFDNWLKQPPPGPAKWVPRRSDFYSEKW